MKQVVPQNTGRVTLRQSQFFAPSWAQISGEITFVVSRKSWLYSHFKFMTYILFAVSQISLRAFYF
jgi:hypothetical protein